MGHRDARLGGGVPAAGDLSPQRRPFSAVLAGRTGACSQARKNAVRSWPLTLPARASTAEALRVAQLSDDHGVLTTPHHAPELHCHLVAAFPRGGYAVESHGSPYRDPIWRR